MDPIYLDHNATTPVAPEVLEAMLPWLREGFGNPSSAHVYGQRAARAVARAREQVAALLGAHPDEIVFTSGGTEADNLAIGGVARALPHRRGFVTTAVEHPAVAAPLARLAAEGASVTTVAVDAAGRVDAGAVLAAVTDHTALISVMLANNETGALQPVAAIGADRRGALLHTDAAQAVGKIPIDVDALGVDLLTVAGHKLYAPKGVGALYVRRGTPLAALQLGASHEGGRRGGTENVAGVVALGAACALAGACLEGDPTGTRADRLLDRLLAAIPGLRLNGPARDRLPNTLNVRFPGAVGSAVLAAAPEVAASTGSACHDHGESPSAVLLAMGLPPHEALGAVRLSLGRGTGDADVARAADALIAAWHRVRA